MAHIPTLIPCSHACGFFPNRWLVAAELGSTAMAAKAYPGVWTLGACTRLSCTSRLVWGSVLSGPSCQPAAPTRPPARKRDIFCPTIVAWTSRQRVHESGKQSVSGWSRPAWSQVVLARACERGCERRCPRTFRVSGHPVSNPDTITRCPTSVASKPGGPPEMPIAIATHDTRATTAAKAARIREHESVEIVASNGK